MAISRSRTNAFTKKRAPVFTVSACTTCGERLDTSSAFKDATGKLWCQGHEKRGMLLDWATKYGYPAIRFTGKVKKFYPVSGLPDYIAPEKFAIGIEGSKESKDLWEISVLRSNNNVIDAAIAYVGIVVRDRVQDDEMEDAS